MGRLISVNDGKDETKYTYNYEGLRVTKETGNKKVLYIYDGKNVLLELDSLGNVSARHVFGTKLISRLKYNLIILLFGSFAALQLLFNVLNDLHSRKSVIISTRSQRSF